MYRILVITLLTGGALYFPKCLAQPLGVIPTQYNGSFAGGVNDPRINTDFEYHRQNPINHYSATTSYDQMIPAIRSGIALSASYYSSNYKTSTLSSKSDGYNIYFAVAPKFSLQEKGSLKGKFTISPSIDIRYYSSGSTLSWQPNENWPDSVSQTNVEGFSSRLGILMNTRNYYVGYSARLLNFNTQSKNIGEGYNSGFYSTLQAGYSYQKKPDSKFSITPEIAITLNTNPDFPGKFKDKTDFFIADYNLRFRYDKLLWGIARGMRGVAEGTKVPSLQLGYQQDSWRVLTTHGFEDGYSGNLSFRNIFKKSDDPFRDPHF